MKLSFVYIAAICVAILSGCASGAKVENIAIPVNAAESYSQKLTEQISIEDVSGGKSTNPLWTSQISNEVFQEALSNALQSRGLLSSDGVYSLTAKLVKVEQPLFSFATTVTTHIVYTIKHRTTAEILFEKTMVAPASVKVSEEFVGVKRLRLANEKSATENIKMFLEELSKLEESSISFS